MAELIHVEHPLKSDPNLRGSSPHHRVILQHKNLLAVIRLRLSPFRDVLDSIYQKGQIDRFFKEIKGAKDARPGYDFRRSVS